MKTISKYLIGIILLAFAQIMRAEDDVIMYNVVYEPAKASVVSEYGSDKGDKEQQRLAKEMKKEYKASSIDVQKWKDGSNKLVLYLKDKTTVPSFIVKNYDGGNIFYGKPLTAINITRIDDKFYYSAENKNERKYYFSNADGSYYITSSLPINVCTDGDQKLVVSFEDGLSCFYKLTDGKILFVAQGHPSVKVVNALAEGLRQVSFNGITAEIFGPAVEKSYLAKTSRDYNASQFFRAHDGQAVGSFDPQSDSYFLSPESGYILRTSDILDLDFRKSKRVTEVGGKMIGYDEIATTQSEVGLSLTPIGGKDLLYIVYNLSYSIPDHSFRYESYAGPGKRRQGAIFLQDTSLNVPPAFMEVNYLYDEASANWKPYVRRRLFTPSEPYHKGLENAAELPFDNLGDSLIHYGEYFDSFHKYYNELPENYKWTMRDIQLVRYAAVSDIRKRLSKAELGGLGKHLPANLLVSNAQNALDVINNSVYSYAYSYAIKALDKAAVNGANSEVKAEAAKMRDELKDDCARLDVWAQNIKKDKEALIASLSKTDSDKTASTKAQVHIRELRQQQRVKNPEVNQAIVLGVAMAVNNAMRTVFGQQNTRSGGRGFNVIYTPGSSNNVSAGAVSTPAPTSSGNGASVQKAPKCTACGGSGQCNACHGHPGKATSASNSPKCSSCHGNVRCPYCNGTGYKSL